MTLGEIEVAHDAAASPYADMSWQKYQEIADRVMGRFEGHYRRERFDYIHPDHLQPRAPERFRKPYAVKVGYYEWGNPAKPLMICCGGVANVARRFSYLAMDLMAEFHVVCPDWVGRGDSGWMGDQGDYSLATYVEQTRQLIAHLGNRPAVLLGSSMGGTVAIELAAAAPELVRRIILNDIGPYIPAARRARRAQTLARHYVFRTPAEMFRKTGASQKNDGPVSDDARLNGSYCQTKWSDEEGGRIYRHDIRALQEYQLGAGKNVRQWKQWEAISCPVLVCHGMDTDALLPQTLKRMMKKKTVSVMHIPNTGHTPTLTEPNHIWCIRQWLRDDSQLVREFSSPYSPPPPGSEKRAAARPII